MNPDQSNGVTGQMMQAGAEAFMQAPYVGVAINVGGATSKVLDSPSAIGCALAKAFPAMLDKAEAGARDTLLHPGPIGGADLSAWHAMTPAHWAQYVLHQAPAHLLGVAAMLAKQRIGNPGFDAGLAFLGEAVIGLARQMDGRRRFSGGTGTAPGSASGRSGAGEGGQTQAGAQAGQVEERGCGVNRRGR